ncbi:MAG: Cell envelope-related transcriptional attenuator, partial [Candidatus Curtissbacteria bacterium GW2011_GWD1_40_8]
MRQLGTDRKKSPNIFKILTFTILLTALTFAAIKITGLDKIIFKGPKTVVQLITDTGLKSDNGRTNILLLGIGGQGHEGPDLSDTMILASVDKEGKDVVLVSIPRDLWAPGVSAKINAVYAYGQEKDESGLSQVKKASVELFGLPIHYAFRIDFDGFIKAIDLVNGLDVEVENTFVDSRYPIAGRQD